MKTIHPTAVGSAAFLHAASSFNRLLPRVAFAPEDGGGAFSSGDEKKEEQKDSQKDPAKGDEAKPSDQEAKLLKEVMKKKEQIEALEAKLKSFDGVNPDEIKSLLDEKKAAEKAKKDAEKRAAEAAGDVERLKTMMAEEHKKELDSVQNQLAELQKAVSQRDSQINDLTIGQAFASSKFITEELVLTPTKTKAVYGAHFGYEDGKIVAYDKPAGSGERTKIVDARGEPLSFEAALRKLVESDPDRDYVLKSKMASGAGSKPGASQSKTQETSEEVTGARRISAILAKGGAFRK